MSLYNSQKRHPFTSMHNMFLKTSLTTSFLVQYQDTLSRLAEETGTDIRLTFPSSPSSLTSTELNVSVS